MRRMIRILLAVITATSAWGTLGAQEHPTAGAELPEEMLEPSPFRVASGTEVPRYMLVEEFFSEGFGLYQSGLDWLDFNCLRPMGIEPGSPAADALVRGLLRGKAAMTGVFDAQSHLSDEQIYEEKQTEFVLTRVRQVAEAYRQMLKELEQVGVSSESVEHFIDEVIAPGVSVFASNGPSLETQELFDMVNQEYALTMAREDEP